MVKKQLLLVNLTKFEQELIEIEIKEGKRPKHWDVVTHPDHKMWEMMLAACKDVGVTKRI